MNSGTGQRSSSHSSLSYVTRDDSADHQATGYSYSNAYIQQFNSDRQSMLNCPAQITQDYLNWAEKFSNLNRQFIQRSNHASTSSSGMKDSAIHDLSNSSENGENLQTDNNGLKSRSNCDYWNMKGDINRYITNGTPSDQCSISEDSDGDSLPKIVVDSDDDEHENKEEIAVVKRKRPSSFEIIEPLKMPPKSHQIHSFNQSQSTNKFPINEYVVVGEQKMDEIIAKELDLALALCKKSHRLSRGYRSKQQAKQKTRSKTGKKSSIKNRLISITVERIKSAVFNCSSKPPSFKTDKISDRAVNQQLKQEQLIPQPESWNQYQANSISGQAQHPASMYKSSPQIIYQSVGPHPVDLQSCRYCTCKKTDAPMYNALPPSSVSIYHHSNASSANFNPTNHPILENHQIPFQLSQCNSFRRPRVLKN